MDDSVTICNEVIDEGADVEAKSNNEDKSNNVRRTTKEISIKIKQPKKSKNFMFH